MTTTSSGRSGTQRRGPWESAFDRVTAMRLAATEYERLADLLAELSPDDWRQPTECPGWDVRAMAGHWFRSIWKYLLQPSTVNR